MNNQSKFNPKFFFRKKSPAPKEIGGLEGIEEKDNSDGSKSLKITLNVSDTDFERARKLMKFTGIVNADNLAACMAEAIQAYRKMDYQHGRNDVIEEARCLK